jgi:hypothetical protein
MEGSARCCSLSALQHQQLLGAGIAEAELAIKTAAVGGHQINALYPGYPWGVKKFFHHAAAKPVALQITGHHHIPEHGTAVAIGTGPTKAHKSFATPDADYRITAYQQPPQLGEAATPSPKGMAIEQSLQLD